MTISQTQCQRNETEDCLGVKGNVFMCMEFFDFRRLTDSRGIRKEESCKFVDIQVFLTVLV